MYMVGSSPVVCVYIVVASSEFCVGELPFGGGFQKEYNPAEPKLAFLSFSHWTATVLAIALALTKVAATEF